MANYVIGDVQGCRAALEDLLAQFRFDPARDHLWFAGDLVARGPDSLGTLRLVKNLGAAADTVLGNHDLHLIAAHHGLAKLKDKDGTTPILLAHDRDALMNWLAQRPLLIDLPDGSVLSHAGIPPDWALDAARTRAREVEAALRGPGRQDYLAGMYGNEPARWSDDLAGATRLRVITNCLTRMRLLDAEGNLDFAYKAELAMAPPGLTAWFLLPSALAGQRQFFGHWAALQGETGSDRHIALDTGCVWGGPLTAIRLEDHQRFQSRPGLR